MENSSHKYIPEIDVVRAAAFLLVTITHCSVPTWTDGIVASNLLEELLLSLIKTGWIGVPLFLFISGYSLTINKTSPDYKLNIKQFYINRILRIFPVWVTCILILKWSHNLNGGQFLSLLLFNTQDLPKSTSFNIAWSIQLEFFCYFLFPMFLSFLNDRKQVFLIFCTLLAFRVMLFFVPSEMIYELSYSNIFGGATLFLAGMLMRAFVESKTPVQDKIRSYAYWISTAGIVLLIGMLQFVSSRGGYQAPAGRLIHPFFMLMPEICSAIFIIITVPYFLRAAVRIKNHSLITKAISHLGMISYSAYMFSLFTLDFVSEILPGICRERPGDWIAYSTYLTTYLLVLIAFSTLTYQTIEKPFLSKRKKY